MLSCSSNPFAQKFAEGPMTTRKLPTIPIPKGWPSHVKSLPPPTFNFALCALHFKPEFHVSRSTSGTCENVRTGRPRTSDQNPSASEGLLPSPCQKKGSRERLPFVVIGLDGRFRNRPFHPCREDVQGLLEARPPVPRSPGLRWSEAGSRWRLHSGERSGTPWSDR